MSEKLIYFVDGGKLKFKKGAEVDVTNTKLPEVWDVSMYDNVRFVGCNLAGVKEIKFKDKKQKREFTQAYSGFSGKAVYYGTGGNANKKGGKLKYVAIAGLAIGAISYCSSNDGKNDRNDNNEGEKIEVSVDGDDKEDGNTINFEEAESTVGKIKRFKEETRRKRDKKKEDKREQTRQETIDDLEDLLRDMAEEDAKKQNGNGQGKQRGNKKTSKQETVNTLEQMLRDMEH